MLADLIRTLVRALLMTLCLGGAVAVASETRHDDVARFLAGLELPGGSPLEPFSRDPAWRTHAQELDSAWWHLERTQLEPVRTWSAAHVRSPSQTLLYMFSGPDYLYARSFFPHASTYVLAGLEVPGVLPDLSLMEPDSRRRALDVLRTAMKTVLSTSFFVTADMQRDLHGRGFQGVLPVLMVFLARSGMEIRDVSQVALLEDGAVESLAAAPPGRPSGVRIGFHDRAQQMDRTLFYFSVDLSNAGLNDGAFVKFLDRQGPTDAFFKSTSYLVHGGNFSRIRSAVLKRSVRIIQDDTGVRLDDFPSSWKVTPFGTYSRPIQVFEQMYQPSMAKLFEEGNPAPLSFRLGYGYGVHTTGILLATRR